MQTGALRCLRTSRNRENTSELGLIAGGGRTALSPSDAFHPAEGSGGKAGARRLNVRQF